MNILSVVFLVYCVFGHNIANAEDYETWYKRISEKREVTDSDVAFYKAFDLLIKIIAAGDQNYPMDPFFIPFIAPFTYNVAAISVGVALANIKLSGLRNIQIEDVVVDTTHHVAQVRTSLPWISLSANLNIYAPALLIPDPACADLDVFLTNPIIDFRFLYEPTNPGHILLVDVDIDVIPGTTSLKLAHYEGSRILNELVNTYLQAAATQNLKYEMPTIVKLIEERATPYLSKFLSEHNFLDVPLRSYPNRKRSHPPN